MAAFLVLLLIACVASAPQPKHELINKLLNAVEKAADFFSSDYANINADGVFGLRIGQGQLLQALGDCNQKHCDEKVLSRVRRVESIIEETCQSAMPYLKELDPKYYHRFFPLMKEPYQPKYRPYRFKHLETVLPGTITAYSEEDGDGCFARLMGTYVTKNEYYRNYIHVILDTHLAIPRSDEDSVELLPKCNTTNHCFEMMTQEGAAQYTITHQLFYFIIMEHTGCDKMGGVITSREVRTREEKFCKIIYKEAETFWNDNDVFAGYQDLFLEQGLLCGILGFEDFMRTDWAKAVLRWQTHEGCFKSKKQFTIFEEWAMPHVETRKTPMRRLQRETHMSGGCLSHKSGLGFGYLATYLRYLIRTA